MKVDGIRLTRWAKRVKQRDDFTCKKCGETFNLLAHHIKAKDIYHTLAYRTTNGITLCAKCHGKEPKQRKLFTSVKIGGTSIEWYIPLRLLILSGTNRSPHYYNIPLANPSVPPPTSNPIGKLYTPREMAIRYGMNEEYIRRLLRTEKLTGYQFGLDWRVSDVDLQAFVTTHKNKERQ